MSETDHVTRMEAYLDARAARGYSGTIATVEADSSLADQQPGMYERRALTDADVRAAVNELKQVRTACGKTQDVRPGHGPGVPGAMHLEAFGQSIADAFGDCPYHVGSSATSKDWRDVDVRLILNDDRFHALFPGFKNANHIDAWWSLLCAALSELGRVRTGLPVDFQIQSMTEANQKYPGIRNPLFLIHAKDDHRPMMQPEPCDGDCDCDCDCDCRPGQPCLCPERDCYCGPCRVCDRDEGDGDRG